ncbi:restriction endonuclease [Epibacterium sp. DP7N7-1]|nr:restriction endonuclease [Epibacterium sp. DP7N7-1]
MSNKAATLHICGAFSRLGYVFLEERGIGLSANAALYITHEDLNQDMLSSLKSSGIDRAKPFQSLIFALYSNDFRKYYMNICPADASRPPTGPGFGSGRFSGMSLILRREPMSMGQSERALQVAGQPSARRVWMVRLGRTSAAESAALKDGLVTFDAGVRGDLKDSLEYEDIFSEVMEANPDLGGQRLNELSRHLYLLLHDIQAGDLLVAPLKSSGAIAIGQFRGDHGVDADNKPGRRVQWLRTDLSREIFGLDLLYSMNAKQSVVEITRNDCEKRISAILSGAFDPGPSGDHDLLPNDPEVIERLMRQRLLQRMGVVFAGHALADLVGEIIRIKGFQVRIAPPGPDGGVDIHAGTGPLGTDHRLIVQVKSGSQVAGKPVLQQLEGAMRAAKAENGMLVSWGGFSREAAIRMNELWYEVRLWTAADVMEAYIENYENLPVKFRDMLPLRKIWTV